jgi:hypothetical protein
MFGRGSADCDRGSRIAGPGNALAVVEEVASSPMLLYAAIGTGSSAANINRLAIRRRFCAMAASRNASRTARSPEAQSIRLQDSLAVSEEHLDLLAVLGRLLVAIGLDDSARDLPCRMDAASDLAHRCVRTAAALGIGLDHAGVHGKAFAADQAFLHAALHHTRIHVLEARP